MKPVQLIVNGHTISEMIEPRVHLADFLRERLNLTGTHLRCEQGACGACTILIDGQPARSCITFAVLCDQAEINTIEGMEDDPVMIALRRAFSEEHGLQCGYCTPGMLMTARDIVMRLPDADPTRIRTEISGNLCRCTGYVGIVRAISRVLSEQREGQLMRSARKDGALGPVGARRVGSSRDVATLPTQESAPKAESSSEQAVLGLGGRRPNVEINQFITVSRPPEEVWAVFADIARMVSCLPGATLTRPPVGDLAEGRMSIRLGPITANFSGQARVVRDDARRRGLIMGAGKDQLGDFRAAGEVEYALEATAGEGTRVALTIRALLVGPLAQFGRSGIVEDLVRRITDAFARNLEADLTGTAIDNGQREASLNAGTLLWQVIVARVKARFAKIFGNAKS